MKTATARALKEMHASLTILGWLCKRLGLCCIELHYGIGWGTQIWSSFLRNFVKANKEALASLRPQISLTV